MSAATLAERPPRHVTTPSHVRSGRAMPIKTTRLVFDEDGYPDWYAVVRTNVRGGVMDEYRSGDAVGWWNAIAVIVQEWNFADEDGDLMPLPARVKLDEDGKAVPESANGTLARDLPDDLLSALLRRFREAFNAESQPPKESSANSTTTSTT